MRVRATAARHVDDRARATLGHGADDGLRAEVGALQVRVDDPVPPRLVALEEVAARGLVGGDRGVVDQHVDRAVRGDGRRDHLVDRRLRGDVGNRGDRRAAGGGDGAHDLGRAGRVDVVDGHPRALAREPLGHRAADPVAGTCHQHALSVEPSAHRRSPIAIPPEVSP